jgi:transcriptional regulator with PAS, ATPase and Fis domain
VTIRIPPLRQRGEDVGLLAYCFLQQCNSKYGKSLTLSSAVLHFFYNYEWPGNVRELQNCIEYVSIMCSDNEIYVEHLPLSMLEANGDVPTAPKANSSGTGSLRDEVQLTEKELILRALKTSKNNKTAAMKVLGVSRRTFYRKLKEFGLMEIE